MQVKSKVPIVYNVIIEGEDQIEVDWGNDPGWIQRHKDALDNAERISLIPKIEGPYPRVTVLLDGDKRWVLGSRVHGSMTDGTGIEFRTYFIGWQRTVGSENVKSIQWVYPGGAVECSPEPTMVGYFREHFKRHRINRKVPRG